MEHFWRALDEALQQIRWIPMAILGVLSCIATVIALLWLSGGSQGTACPFSVRRLVPASPVEISVSLPESDQTVSSTTLHAYDPSSSQLLTMDLEEYILGVVAGEMPASYETEALKAQAVAARSFVAQKIESGSGCSRHAAADVCLDSSHCQAYLSPEARRERWGEDFSLYEEKLRLAVQDTRALVAFYDGRPIRALYHASSGGQTEDVLAVFQMDLPYLAGVSSPGEEETGNFENTLMLSRSEVANRLAPLGKVSAKKLEKQLEVLQRSDSGRVLTIRVGQNEVSGREFRSALGLNSTCFTLEYTDSSILFHTRGYGHGVGMSQAGANAMAKDGADFEEILLHYYTGVTLQSWSRS